MEYGGIASNSSSDPETISAEERNPNLEEDTDEENPNLEEANPNLTENLNELNAIGGNAVDMEGFAENVVNDVDERVSVACTQSDDFQVAKRIAGKGEDGGEECMETQALDATGCPICMEPWTSVGAHRISCLPCGHLFGWSCIKKWIQKGGKGISKCPQCNRKCKFREIRILYVPRVAVVDGEMQQELTLLRAENEKLKLENRNLINERHQRMEEKEYYLDIKHLRIEKNGLLEEIQRLLVQRALSAATIPEQYGSPSGCQSTLFSDVGERRDYDFHAREGCEPLSKRRLIHLGQGEMIPKHSLNQTVQLGNSQGLGVGNSSAGNLQLPSTDTASQHPMAATARYTKVWEGLLTGQRQGKPVPISKLEAYRNITSSETLATDWPASLQIIRLIAQDHISSRHYQGIAEFLIFRPLNPHGFLVQLADKKLSAVIQLPNQTLLLSASDRPGRMLGMLLPRDTVVFKPQPPNQPHLQQQPQQQQEQLQQQQQI